ncbi:MAG: hypothetical protein WDN06_10690 [Asticcacaulis sp.]
MTRFHRPLTSAEIAALPPGLVAAVDIAFVRLVADHHPLSRLSLAVRGFAVILVRGQNIFWPGLVEDMGDDATAMTILGHELVHVWQYAHGMTVASYVWRDLICRQGRYDYRLAPGKAFTAYGYEQQAAMVEDWMRLDAGLSARWSRTAIDKAALAAIVPFL